MKIEEYAALRGKYPMPEDAVAVGTAADRETGDLVAIPAARPTPGRATCAKRTPPLSYTPAPARCRSSYRTCL